MILDSLASYSRYTSVHPRFARAFDFLTTTDLASLPAGRHQVVGDEIYVSIDHVDGRGREGARLEAHRDYIDIQVTIEGAEAIGWRPLADCRQPAGGFSEGRDIGFYDDAPVAWFAMPPGHFAVFFPDDAHAPLGASGPVKKAIVKILVQQLTRRDGTVPPCLKSAQGPDLKVGATSPAQ